MLTWCVCCTSRCGKRPDAEVEAKILERLKVASRDQGRTQTLWEDYIRYGDPAVLQSAIHSLKSCLQVSIRKLVVACKRADPK